MKIVTRDMNYFGKGSTVKDCVIRALACATNFGYRFLMKLFGMEKNFNLENGYGRGPGISKEQLQKFAKKTGILELIWGDDEYSEYLYQYGTTDAEDLEHFMKNDFEEIIKDAGKGKYKRFVIIVRPGNKKGAEMKESSHAIPMMLINGEWTTVDVKTIRQIQYSIPIYVYSVEKIAKKDSEYSLQTEYEEVKAEFEEFQKINREFDAEMKKNQNQDDK